MSINVSEKPRIRRVDIHHHFFPDSLDKIGSYKTMGWRPPAGNLPWRPEISIESMDASSVDIAILSLPALSSGSVGEQNRALARERNQSLAEICQSRPERFGFFATTPFLDDIEGVLKEIAHALDELGADGVSLSSSYGDGANGIYIGAQRYDPIWEELNRRKAVVFLHGNQTPSSTPYPDPFLGLPITEVPNETFKAAAHLVVTGRKRKYPDVKVILAHLGGSTPFLAPRIAILSGHMGCSLSPEEILEDFQSFYYDTALSAHHTTLTAMETLVKPDHLLFGTDFPAVSTDMAQWYTKNLLDFYENDQEKLDGVMFANAMKLFPRLKVLP